LLQSSGESTSNQLLLEGYQSVLDENWSEALERFRKVQRQYPLTPGLMQLISSCLHELGQSEEALRSLTKASLVEPDNPGVQDQIQQIKLENALAAQTRRDWRQSIRLLEELVKADETHSGYWLNLGYSRQNMGRLTEAVAAYQKGLALDPDAGWARINLASSLYLLSRFDKARIEWERIIAKDETAEAYYQLGLCYSHLNREPEAEVAFEKAVTLGGETPELNYNLGITRLRLLRTQEGWTLIRRAALKGYAPALDMVRRAREKR
jgi:tetratricopeptide (TPR) repeat protein